MNILLFHISHSIFLFEIPKTETVGFMHGSNEESGHKIKVSQ